LGSKRLFGEDQRPVVHMMLPHNSRSAGGHAMQISDYWSKLQQTSVGWLHPDDEEVLARSNTSFNFDFPPPAFVGDVLSARVIILTANGGYDPIVTPKEFPNAGTEAHYVHRLSNPKTADWAEVAPYYTDVNYAQYLVSRKVALVNACAYRSKKISQEPANSRVIATLPSAMFNRRWLIETVLPDAHRGARIIVGKRHGLWNLPEEIKNSPGFVADPAPISPHLSRAVLDRIAPLLA
jgi:hypothetical protein